MKRSLVLLLALAALGCHGSGDRDRSPVSICPSLSLPVSCDGSLPKVLDGGWLACPPGCAIATEPCERLFSWDERPPGCEGYACLHIVICPCDGSPCAPDIWDWRGFL